MSSMGSSLMGKGPEVRWGDCQSGGLLGKSYWELSFACDSGLFSRAYMRGLVPVSGPHRPPGHKNGCLGSNT